MDVNTIFKDLATMVHEQWETIDSIEGNVEQASITVHDGTEQLRQAERYKVRYQKILNLYPAHCIYFILFFVFILFHHYNIFSEQSEKEESVFSYYWNCHSSNYHWDNCLASQEGLNEITKSCDMKLFKYICSS